MGHSKKRMTRNVAVLDDFQMWEGSGTMPSDSRWVREIKETLSLAHCRVRLIQS